MCSIFLWVPFHFLPFIDKILTKITLLFFQDLYLIDSPQESRTSMGPVWLILGVEASNILPIMDIMKALAQLSQQPLEEAQMGGSVRRWSSVALGPEILWMIRWV